MNLNNAEKELRSEIYKVAHAYAKFDELSDTYSIDYDDVSEFDKSKLAALCIEAADRDIHCIYENDADATSDLLKLLEAEDRDDEIYFARQLKEKITNYYEKKIIEMLDDVCNEMENMYAA